MTTNSTSNQFLTTSQVQGAMQYTHYYHLKLLKLLYPFEEQQSC